MITQNEGHFKMLGSILRHPVMPKILLNQVRSVHGITKKYFIYNKNIFSAAIGVRMFLTRCTRFADGATRPTSFSKPNGLLQNLSIRHQQTLQLDVNMNVQNNVILYKLEKDAYFRNVRIFAIGQLFGWAILALYTYTPSFWDIFNTDINFKKYLFEHMFRLGIFFCSIVIGPLMFLYIYGLCTRSVKYVILHKGGKALSIITYHMRKKKSTINVPTEMVKCTADRTGVGNCLPLKITNKSLYYLIDKEGTFVNPKLFDHAVG